MRTVFYLRTSLLFLTVILLSAIFSNQAVFSQSIKVKVGCLYPLTGPGGLYGRDSVAGARLALEVLNEQRQHGDPEIEVLFGDTRSKSLRTVQSARSFIEKDGVDFLCGVVSSGVALSVTEVAKQKQVFFIGTDHASPRLVSEALHPFYFRVSNGTRQSMRAGARHIKRFYAKKKPLRIAFVGPDYDYGYQAWDDLKAFLKEEKVNYKVVGVFWPKLFEPNFSPYIHAVMDSEPDIVVNGHWGQDLVTFVKQGSGLKLFDGPVFMNFDAGGNFEILSELGADMPLGLVLSARHHVNWPDTRENRKFVSTFYEKFGRYPSYAAEGAYSGILAISQAVKNAGGTDKEKLRQALKHLKLTLPEDPEGFKSHMDPDSHQILQVQVIGKTIRDESYAPARVLLGEWQQYYPPAKWPDLK
ncbi:MAG: ABC transporter substrate-binding protein [Methyloligellaceae bacterium]